MIHLFELRKKIEEKMDEHQVFHCEKHGISLDLRGQAILACFMIWSTMKIDHYSNEASDRIGSLESVNIERIQKYFSENRKISKIGSLVYFLGKDAEQVADSLILDLPNGYVFGRYKNSFILHCDRHVKLLIASLTQYDCLAVVIGQERMQVYFQGRNLFSSPSIFGFRGIYNDMVHYPALTLEEFSIVQVLKHFTEHTRNRLISQCQSKFMKSLVVYWNNHFFDEDIKQSMKGIEESIKNVNITDLSNITINTLNNILQKTEGGK